MPFVLSAEDGIIPSLISALTHVHVGAGRSPGTVDLPIIRDPFGVPFIPGSSVKGALKTALSLEKNCLTSQDNKTNCSNCKEVCCYLGPEDGTEGASRLVITDFYPLLVPVPSLEDGFAYVTFPRLVRYAKSLVQSSSGLLKKIIDIESSEGDTDVELTLGVEKFKAKKKIKLDNDYTKVHPFLESVNVYLLEDKLARFVFDKITVKVTRVRIDRKTKTVAAGMLWTEEYLPHGTILVGAFVQRNWNNNYCENVNKDWKEALGFEGNSRELVLGGKETVGKGLVRIILQ